LTKDSKPLENDQTSQNKLHDDIEIGRKWRFNVTSSSPKHLVYQYCAHKHNDANTDVKWEN
jgi:hypothetical protein